MTACLLLTGGIAAGCSRLPGIGSGPSGTGAKPTALLPGEVRQYKGERLGAINDFIENSIKGPQKVDITTYRLKVDGRVRHPLTLTYDQVVKERPAYTKVITLHCVEGWSVKILWQGAKLSDLIDEASATPGANTVIFHAVDGYTSSLPISYVRGRDILLAYKMNGLTMRPERGFPFQVLAEDKYGYKWVKWVTRIELSTDAGYRGYWEQRGYSNEATIPANAR
jgi:DMSO/TMAO reductase YedYZ molybdopterin-dependent catalytic subunit